MNIHSDECDCRSKNNKQCIFLIGAYVEMKTAKMRLVANKLSAKKLESDAIFEYIIDQVKAQPAKAKSINGIFLYKITVDGKPAKEWSKYLV